MADPAPRKMKKIVVITDTHAPLHDERAVSAVCNYISHYKPDAIIHAGDVGHFESVSHWIQDKRLKLEGLRLRKDMDAALAMLNRFKNIPEKIVCMGNHDDWVAQYVDKNPAVAGFVDLEREYKQIGWKVVPLNKPYQIGKLLVFHGLYTCTHHAKATVHAYSKSCMYGHTHDAQLHTESFYDGEKSAQSIGCLCDMNPDYLKNRQKRWVHGFATVDLDTTTGDFYPDFVKIVKGRFSRNGIIYKG
jgi:predicted phosphodiesterase